MKGLSCILTFVIICSYSFGQNENFNGPHLFIAMSWNYAYTCEEHGNSYLQLQDSTLIPFNQHSTFEDRLALGDSLLITPGDYRIVYLTEESGIIASIPFSVSEDHEGEHIEVSFDSLNCCVSTKGMYLYYETDSTIWTENQCASINSLTERIDQSSEKIKIVALYNDQISQDIALSRLETLKAYLTKNSIDISNITFNTEFRDELPFFPIGNKIVYYDGEYPCFRDNNCHVGILLLQE